MKIRLNTSILGLGVVGDWIELDLAAAKALIDRGLAESSEEPNEQQEQSQELLESDSRQGRRKR